METRGTKDILTAIISPYDQEEDEPLALILKNQAETPSASASNNESPDFYLPAPESVVPSVPLRVNLLITDENQSVAKMVRDCFPGLRHEADPWHLRKAIMKKFSAAAAKKGNQLLSYWLPSIRNWLWTSMKECHGDGELLIELWRSILYHIRGQHSWTGDSTFKKFTKCVHKDLSNTDYAYLPPESTAFACLVDIIEDVSLQNRLRRCTSFLQTSQLESFHALLCKYLPKHLRFIGVSFEARVRMAVMDWNENVGRPVQLDEHGGERLRFEHPAACDEWRARIMKIDRTSQWRHRLMTELSDFAVNRWKEGHVLCRSSNVTLHMPLVSLYEPVDHESVAAQLYR